MSSRVALAVAGCLVCASMPMAAEVQTPPVFRRLD